MTDTAPRADLEGLADEFWEALVAAHPVTATSLGIAGHDDRLDDPSPAAQQARRDELEGQLRRARAIDPSELDEDGAATHGALIGEIIGELEQLASGLDEWRVDPLDGPPVFALDIPAFQPHATAEQGRAMVERWRAMGPWLDAHSANLRRALADGRVAVRTPVVKTIDGVREVLARPDADLPLLEPATADHPQWTTSEVAAFREGLASAVRDAFRPALERYLAVLEEEILPKTRGDDQAGLAHIPAGDESYRSLIRVHTSLDLAPAEIHRLGLLETERIDAELAELGARVLRVHGLEAVLERLRTDRSLYFSTGDEVHATARKALSRADDAIPAWFGLLPRAACEVVRMPAHEEKHSTIAYYRQPAVDGTRPGQFFVNTSAPETRPRYEAEALAYHEAIPGHHLQMAIGQELATLPEFRRHLGPTAFFEGWGLYTERLSDEMGLYSSDLDRIGILSFDGWRACRLVVDTGIHALGWTRQQAIDFITAHTALAPNNIANEVDRYIVWPGQALAYKIGQLEILRLRDEAQVRQGDRFDIRAFHDAVLGQGALGLEALRAVVERRLT